jgi:hypothetical protein
VTFSGIENIRESEPSFILLTVFFRLTQMPIQTVEKLFLKTESGKSPPMPNQKRTLCGRNSCLFMKNHTYLGNEFLKYKTFLIFTQSES